MQKTGTTVHMVARAELSISRLSEQLLNLLQGETSASRTTNTTKISYIAMAEGGNWFILLKDSLLPVDK